MLCRHILNKKTFKRSPQIALSLVLAVAFCLFLLPSPAHAQVPGSEALTCVSHPIDCMVNWVRSLLINLIALTGSGIDAALRAPVSDSPVVASSWEIVRGFANMFFILALIIMAFGTIFSISKYDFRTLIARLLIAALLINFSLVIGQIIIDWSTSLSNVFLESIGNIGDRLAQGANISKNLDSSFLSQAPQGVPIADQILWIVTMEGMVNIIMLSIVFFSMAVLFFFSIIRIPILWALLIISPIAWISYVLPTTTNLNRRWWKEFIGWNLFMPIYLFFIYFGVLFLSNQQQVLQNTSGPLVSGFSTAFQDIFFYVLVGIFLIGGAKIAMSSSMAAGAGGVATGIWAKSRATARFGGSLPGRAVGLGWRTIGADQVYKEASEKFKRQGFAGFEKTEKTLGRFYRGQQGKDEAAAKLGGIDLPLIGKVAPGLAGKQFEKNIGNYQERYRIVTDEGELRGFAATGPLEQQVAAKNRLRELGRLSTTEEMDLYTQLEGAGQHLAARRQADKIDYGSLSKTERENAYNTITDLDIKRKVQNIRQKKGDFVDATSMEMAASTFQPGSEDQLEFYKNGKSTIADSFTTTERNAFYNNPGLNPDVRRMVSEIMIDKGEIKGPELQNALNLIPGSTSVVGTPEHRAFLNEANRLLEKARKHDLVNVVQMQTRLGLVANKSAPPGTMFTPTQQAEALTQELGNLSVSKILELPDPVLASPEFGTTVVPTLNLQKIEKLLTDASANQRAIIEPIITTRRTTLSNDTINTRVQPLTSALRRLQGLTRQILNAPTPADKKALIAQAQESVDRSQRLIAEIEDIKYADLALKTTARTVYDHYTGAYYRAIQ